MPIQHGNNHLQDQSTPNNLQSESDGSQPTNHSPATILDVLGDSYTRDALIAIQDEAKSGATVAEETGMSEPTAFRRLNRLVELGFAETDLAIDIENGHHNKQYEATINSLSITASDTGFTVATEHSKSDTPSNPSPHAN